MKNKNLILESKTVLIPLFLIVYSWLSLNIFFGYFLSKIFYSIDNDDKTRLSKSIKFNKKLTLKDITKIIYPEWILGPFTGSQINLETIII